MNTSRINHTSLWWKINKIDKWTHTNNLLSLQVPVLENKPFSSRNRTKRPFFTNRTKRSFFYKRNKTNTCTNIETLLRQCLVKTRGPDNDFRHSVGITVWGGSSVLQVALLFLCHLARNSDTGPAVSDSCREVMDTWGFVESC